MAFVIPTIYTAVDKMTPAFQKMAVAGNNFAMQLEYAAHRSDRAWTNIMPNFSDAFERRIQFMISMGQAMAVAGTALFAGKTIMDYERALANLRAITGATGQEFDKFKNIIQQTAKDSSVSAVDVATAFTTIGNAMPALLESADGLNTMTNAVIRLARASNMELQPAAQSLTTILNQFGKSADFAETAIQTMAAGSKYGSSEINNLQASLLQFGATAKEVSNITLQESIALAELVSKYKVGADAGTEMRNVLLEMSKGFAQDDLALKDLQRAGVNIQMVADKTVPFNQRLKEMSKILSVQEGVLHVFGKENENMAISLLSLADYYDAMAEKVNEVGNIERMAAENTNTLYYRFEKLKGAFANIVVASSASSVSLRFVNGFLYFMTNHLEGIVAIGAAVVSFFAAWKIKVFAMLGVSKAATIAINAFEFATGFATMATGKWSATIVSTEAAIKGMAAATWIMKASMLSLGIAAGSLVFALGALTIAFGGDSYDSLRDYGQELESLKNGFVEIVKPMDKARIAQEQFNAAAREYNEIVKFKNFEDYYKQIGGMLGFLTLSKASIEHPILSTKSLLERMRGKAIFEPQKSDYFKEGITEEQALMSYKKDSTSTQYIHHTVDITQNGKTVASFNTAGLPSLGSTF